MNGISHKDLKLENILLTDELHIIIADLGFATKERLTNNFSGTREYASPEMLREDVPYDSMKYDIWSLGVCIYAIATGENLFRKGEPIIEYTVNLKLERIHNPKLKDLLNQYLQFNPINRATAKDILNHYYFSSLKTNN